MALSTYSKEIKSDNVLTSEQDVILDSYIQKLDDFFENLKESEKIQVEIETLHLKRIVAS